MLLNRQTVTGYMLLSLTQKEALTKGYLAYWRVSVKEVIDEEKENHETKNTNQRFWGVLRMGNELAVFIHVRGAVQK